MKEFVGRHILLIIENEAVPFDRRMWNIALALKEHGADVSVVCPIFGKDSEKFTILNGINIYRYKTRFSDGSITGYIREYITAFMKTFFLLHKVLLHRKRIDIIHAANPPDIFWPIALYVRLFNIKFIFDEHDLSAALYLSRFNKQEMCAGTLYKIQKIFQALSYRFANAIISTNESYRNVAIAVNPAYVNKVFVVRNGPDTRYFNQKPSNSSLKRGYSFLAAYIGVMAIHDGVEYIIRAIDVLVHRRNFRDMIVYLIGYGDDWERLKRLSEELCLDKYIVFTGRIPDEPAMEILSTADVCLSPDPYSPLNGISTMTKIMEYMIMGKPIVSFDLKESRYSAGEAAIYVENNNTKAFADGILRLLQDKELSCQMGELGRKRIYEELSWEKQAEKLQSAYEFVLGN